MLLTGGDYEAVVLPEDQELAGFVPLLSISYSPVYVTRGTDRVSGMPFLKLSQMQIRVIQLFSRVVYCM